MSERRWSPRRTLGWGLLVAGLLAYPLAMAADAAFGHDVTILVRLHDEAERAEWRGIRDPRDDVAEIYGKPEPGPPVRVLLRDDARFIVPSEDPTRLLLFVNRAKGEDVVLVRAVRFYAAVVAVIGVVAGVLVLPWGPSRA